MEDSTSFAIFSEWLKSRRKALDLTQEEVARRVGCSIFALRKIESGERRPSKQLAALLATALEIPTDEHATFIRVARGDLGIDRLRASSPPAPAASPPDPARASVLRSLPIPSTPLIGRDAELASMARLFSDPSCRLLTLTGMGGMGKTRLALEFAGTQRVRFPGGVIYIPLAPVNSIEAVIPAMADGMDFSFSGPSDPREQLIHYMAGQFKDEALLVLDNLEHLLAAPLEDAGALSVAELIAEIIQRLPHVRVLGTSRERLNLQGEWTYELHGLPVPPTDFTGRLDDYNAVNMFIKSAQRARADFAATDDERQAVARICRLVEGIPLAIELAAAWVGTLACNEIAAEIEANMDFLSTSMRDIPERHRSIRATFDHSWKLLIKEERRVLGRLSVFRGGFDRSAAAEVAGASLPLLASLSAKSLVRRAESGRYDLHEVIRQYAWLHHQEDPKRDDTYDRHCEHYFAFVEARQGKLKSAAQQETMRELTAEIDNVRAAWAWAVERKKVPALGRAVRGLGWYYEIAGLYTEGIETFEPLRRSLEAKGGEEKWSRVLGLVLMHQALLYFRKGEFDRAMGYYGESVPHLRKVGDPSLLADALIFLGTMLHLNGEYDRSEATLREGLECARSARDAFFEAYGVYNLGYIASLRGRYEEGRQQMMQGLAGWRTVGDPHYIALGLNFMVSTLNTLGRYEEAKTFMRESIALCEQSKNRWGMGTAYRYLGLATLGAGQYAEAQGYLQKSLEIFREYFVGWDIALTRTYIGDAARLGGDLREAAETYRDAVRLALEAHAPPIVLEALAGLADVQAHTGDLQSALRWTYFILGHPSATEEVKERMERSRAAWEAKAGKSQAEAARSKAKEDTIESVALNLQSSL